VILSILSSGLVYSRRLILSFAITNCLLIAFSVPAREGSSRLFYFPNTVKCIVIGWYTGGPSNDLPPAVRPPLIYSGLAPQ
jgi:membrane-bound acyltransferase YfiQ involved in biofilm formation